MNFSHTHLQQNIKHNRLLTEKNEHMQRLIVPQIKLHRHEIKPMPLPWGG
jgi:hypothetical protein